MKMSPLLVTYSVAAIAVAAAAANGNDCNESFRASVANNETEMAFEDT